MDHRLSFPIVEGKQAPTELLRRLREIDPTVELIHFGGGDWRLGSVVPSEDRARQGRMILDQQERLAVKHRSMKNYLLGVLVVQGFAQIEKYTETMGVENTVTDSDGNPCTILEDFRARDSEWRRDQGETVFNARMAVSLGEPERVASDARLRDYVHNDGRDHYRREMRGRKVFGYAGETGGAGKIILPFGG